MEQAKLQLSRTPFPLPVMKLNPSVKNIFDFDFEDFKLVELSVSSTYQGTCCRLIGLIDKI